MYNVYINYMYILYHIKRCCLFYFLTPEKEARNVIPRFLFRRFPVQINKSFFLSFPLSYHNSQIFCIIHIFMNIY